MKKITIDMYSAEILLFNGVKDMQKWMNKNCDMQSSQEMVEFADGTEGIAGVVPTSEGKCYYFITLTSLDLVTLCHECLHIAYMMLDTIGIVHDVNNHEALCYLQHHIFANAGKKYGLLE